jgi:hypothetical protein
MSGRFWCAQHSLASVMKREDRTDKTFQFEVHFMLFVQRCFCLPRPTLDTLRPLFPRFLYLSPGVTDDCRETRGPWFDAVRGVCCDRLCRSCSFVCGVPWVRCSFVLWNSSMQSRLAIGALQLQHNADINSLPQRSDSDTVSLCLYLLHAKIISLMMFREH